MRLVGPGNVAGFVQLVASLVAVGPYNSASAQSALAKLLDALTGRAPGRG